MLHHVQLSFIQLGGGIAVGINAEQKKFYTLLNTPEMLVLEGTSTGVRKTFFFVLIYLITSPRRYGMLEAFFAI